MPAPKSRNRRPSAVYSQAPSPRSKARSARLYVGIRAEIIEVFCLSRDPPTARPPDEPFAGGPRGSEQDGVACCVKSTQRFARQPLAAPTGAQYWKLGIAFRLS